MKKGILFLGILVLVLVISSVSAALCKGNDGYYHDCYSYSYDKYDHNNYRERNVIRLNYYNDYFLRNVNSKTYYITYDNSRSHYRTYYDYDRYERNDGDRIIYLVFNRYYKSYRNDRYINYNFNYYKYDKNYVYYNRDRYNYYDYGYSNIRTSYRVEVGGYKKSYDCPDGWSCISGNRIYL